MNNPEERLDWSEPPDWSKIPVPLDDGAARHLLGTRVAPVRLVATNGSTVDLSTLLGLVVVYAYPRTGVPGVALPPGWDMIPGARGCTPQSCSFRDHFADMQALGVAQVFGLSTQSPEYQLEVATRLRLPFSLLSDEALELTQSLNLPTFETAGMRLLKRHTLIISNGTIEHVFYPVFPPDQSANDVVNWLTKRAG